MIVLAFAAGATGCFSGARSVRPTTPQSTRHQKIFRKRALALGLIVATPYDLRLPFFRGAFTEIGATVWAGQFPLRSSNSARRDAFTGH
ncbi:hypothetical protein [Burkholderia gladioli]|uniref:hypothetical protein n=1 Tax=Burkholderia gladioli TaxID=28095 RepID=UPI001640AC54|nr:hypothetical protein [Burkholderia gladioli]